MIKKTYESIKEFITENYLFLLFLIIFIITSTYPVPYYLNTGGGISDVNNKIDFKNKTKSTGTYNLCYVEEAKANVLTYLLSYVIPSWDLEKEENIKINKKETDKDIMTRDKIYLEAGNNSAIITAFKYANKKVKVINKRPIILHILEEANTNLKIGDEIVNINNYKIETVDDISIAINSKSIGDKVNIKVINKGKEYDKYAYIIKDRERKIIGISLEEKITLKTNPSISLKFGKNETGPSAGFILSLALYDYLIEDDVSKGLKIAGTGTIDNNGNVGEIGGVKYKLKGAVKKHADIFFVPMGNNYNEAIKLKKKNNYKIEVVGVNNFEEAINYLKNVK